MMTDPELEQRLRAMAEREPAPLASEHALEQVLARRARGERVAIRSGPRVSWRWLAAAAAALGVLWLGPWQSEAPAPSSLPTDTTIAANPGGFFLGSPLAAQATAEPSFRRLDDPIGKKLKAGTWLYTRRGLGSTATDTLVAFGMHRGRFQGQDAWLFLSGTALKEGQPHWSDTTWLSADSLRPWARVGRLGDGGRLEETWRDEEVLIGETHNGYTAWRTRPLRYPGFVTTEGQPIRWYQLLARLSTEKLGPDWKGSLQMPGIIVNGTFEGFLNVSVFGDSVIQVPAGSFVCWKVGLGDERSGFFFWVSKDRGWIVAVGTGRHGVEDYSQQLVWAEQE